MLRDVKSVSLAVCLCAAFALNAPLLRAQGVGEGSMQVGNATVSIGGGTALLTLPDVPSFVTRQLLGGTRAFVRGFESSDDFDDEIGWNVNGSIEVPMGTTKTISLNGFWANIEDDDVFTCQRAGNETCGWYPLVDNPATAQFVALGAAGQVLTSSAEREVDNWGVSLESKWTLNPGVMGVTQAPPRRYIALGADIRGIDQDLAVNITTTAAGRGPVSYDEDLDTRYYGAYAAWGGDFPRLLLGGLWDRLGLRSTFMLRGGVYYADTDYSGVLNDSTTVIAPDTDSSLSLSSDDVAFIGGLVLETKKQIGRRAILSLKSEYEYYSYVPEMAYNTVDLANVPVTPGRQVGTVINDDDAFSARSTLRLTIKLGPDSVFEEPIK